MKHRADTPAKTHLAPMDYRPRHCAGTTSRDKRLAPVEIVGRAS